MQIHNIKANKLFEWQFRWNYWVPSFLTIPNCSIGFPNAKLEYGFSANGAMNMEIWTNTNFTVQVSFAFSVGSVNRLLISIWNRNTPAQNFHFRKNNEVELQNNSKFSRGAGGDGGADQWNTKPNKTLADIGANQTKSIECKQNGQLALHKREEWGLVGVFVWSRRAPIHHQMNRDRIVLQLSFYCINSAIVRVFNSMLQSIFRCGWFVQSLHLIVNNGNCWTNSPSPRLFAQSVLIFMWPMF